MILCVVTFGYSQTKSLNSTKEQKNVIKESNAKTLNNSNSKPTARPNSKQQIRHIQRKENHEIAPLKD